MKDPHVIASVYPELNSLSVSLSEAPPQLELQLQARLHCVPMPASNVAVISFHGARQNILLRALPDDELECLFPHLELISLPFGKKLFEFGSKFEFAYFPVNAIVSLFYVMEDGASSEVAVVGSEGVVGLALYERERACFNAVVQSAGYAYRLSMRHLREFFNEGGALPRLLMAYSTAFFCPNDAKRGWRTSLLDRTKSVPLVA